MVVFFCCCCVFFCGGGGRGFGSEIEHYFSSTKVMRLIFVNMEGLQIWRNFWAWKFIVFKVMLHTSPFKKFLLMWLFVCLFFWFQLFVFIFYYSLINTSFSAGRISTSSLWAKQIMCVNICTPMIMNLLMNMLSYLKKRLYKAVDKSCYGDHKTSASRI